MDPEPPNPPFYQSKPLRPAPPRRSYQQQKPAAHSGMAPSGIAVPHILEVAQRPRGGSREEYPGDEDEEEEGQDFDDGVSVLTMDVHLMNPSGAASIYSLEAPPPPIQARRPGPDQAFRANSRLGGGDLRPPPRPQASMVRMRQRGSSEKNLRPPTPTGGFTPFPPGGVGQFGISHRPHSQQPPPSQPSSHQQPSSQLRFPNRLPPLPKPQPPTSAERKPPSGPSFQSNDEETLESGPGLMNSDDDDDDYHPEKTSLPRRRILTATATPGHSPLRSTPPRPPGGGGTRGGLPPVGMGMDSMAKGLPSYTAGLQARLDATKTPGLPFPEGPLPQAKTSTDPSEATEERIHKILDQLGHLTALGATPQSKTHALQVLSSLLWEDPTEPGGPEARRHLVQRDGIEAVHQAMWDEMADPDLQEAAFGVLLAMAASCPTTNHADNNNNDLFATHTDSVTSTLLIVMQTHAHLASLQLLGCSIWACLAAASAHNLQIVDGTLSGALTVVLSAMAQHPSSAPVQRGGLQALFYQCTLSSNAEANKRSLFQTKVDHKQLSALEIILNAMESMLEDPLVLEWASKLLWSLTSSEDLVAKMAQLPVVLPQILMTCQHRMADPEAAPTLEACLGVLGNLSHAELDQQQHQQQQEEEVSPGHFHLEASSVLSTLLEAMTNHPDSYGVTLEGLRALSNLVLLGSAHLRHAVVVAGGLEVVGTALRTFGPTCPEICVSSLRVLLGLVQRAPPHKRAAVLPSNTGPSLLEQVIRLVSQPQPQQQQQQQQHKEVQALAYAWLASLTAQDPSSDDGDEDGSNGAATVAIAIRESGGLEWILQGLERKGPFADAASPHHRPETSDHEAVQVAACHAYRNWLEATPPAHRSQVGLPSQRVASMIVALMEKYEKHTELQIHACACLWSLSVAPDSDRIGPEGIRAIVKAMQNHLDSSDLLEAACGALWSLIHSSLDLKQDAVAQGAIDALVCTLLMHPTSTPTITKACGLFSNISSEESLAGAIVEAGSIGGVVDAIRNNGSALELLEICCLVLNNLLVYFPDQAKQASPAVATILEALKTHMDSTSFQEEACHLLWVLSTEAENCLSQLAASDGAAVLRLCLERHSDNPQVKEAAEGAIHQLEVVS